MAASLAASASWHLVVLAVLALAVHPFELPPPSPAIELQILPPLPKEEPQSPVALRPRIEADSESVPVRATPPAPVEPQPQPQPVPTQPLEAVKPAPQALPKAPEVDRRPTPTAPTVTSVPRLPELTQPAPPAPLIETHATPSPLAKPPEADRPAAAAQLPLSAALPSLDVQPPAEAAPAPATPVLTNRQVVQGPVEIRPRERSSAPLQTTVPGAEGVPGGGEAGGGGAPPAGAGGTTAALPRPNAAEGVIGGYDLKGSRDGMSLRLGCATPDTYRMTPEDHAACMQRLGALARGAADLGPNIPASKQAEFDRQAACRSAYTRQATPGSASASDGTSIAGLGSNPSLRDCKPGDR